MAPVKVSRHTLEDYDCSRLMESPSCEAFSKLPLACFVEAYGPNLAGEVIICKFSDGSGKQLSEDLLGHASHLGYPHSARCGTASQTSDEQWRSGAGKLPS